MSYQPRLLPIDLTQAVDRYVDKERDDAKKYDNREPLDYSGVWSLHALAAEIYAAGFSAGEQVEAERSRAAIRRERI